jgi:hypothetical protein
MSRSVTALQMQTYMAAPGLFGEDQLALPGAAQAVGFAAMGDQDFVAVAEQRGAFQRAGALGPRWRIPDLACSWGERAFMGIGTAYRT